MSDADLIEAARRRDDSAFGEFVERYQPSVFRAVLAVPGSPDDVPGPSTHGHAASASCASSS